MTTLLFFFFCLFHFIHSMNDIYNNLQKHNFNTQLSFLFLHFWFDEESDVESRPKHLRNATVANWKKWQVWELSVEDSPSLISPLLMFEHVAISPLTLGFCPSC